MRLRRRRYDLAEPVIGIRRAMIENGSIEAELESAPEIIATLYAALGHALGNAPNYVEASIEVKPSMRMPHEAFLVTVQRRSGKSPHELRREAEARVEELEAALLELKGQD
jgi:hypothetical protein